MRDPLRFAVLLPRDRLVRRHESAVLEALLACPHATPVLVLSAPDALRPAREAKPSTVPRTLPRAVAARPAVRATLDGAIHTRSTLLTVYRDRWVLPRCAALAPDALPEPLRALPTLALPTDLSAQPLRSALAQADLDFILALGPGCFSALCELAREGVFRFAHDADAEDLHGAPYMWEVLEGAPTTSVRLIAERSDGRRVLHEGTFATCRASWTNNLERALVGSAAFVARAVTALYFERANDGAQVSYAAPGASKSADALLVPRLFAQMSRAFVARAHQLACYVQEWNVGTTQLSPEELLSRTQIPDADVAWLPPCSPGTFVADPFAFECDGREHIVLEEYDHRSRGRLSEVAERQHGSTLALDVALELPEHISYPFVFREDGTLYCLPELYQTKSVRLYRRERGTWTYERTLIEGYPIVDPTLLRHDGHLYLFCTMQDDGAYGNQALHAFVAERLAGPWTPHPLNPLKIDVTSARPAGAPFVRGGALFRPAQDCSHTYGGSLAINRIEALGPHAFREVTVARVYPAPDGRYPDGLHTLNETRSGSVIDGKRFVRDRLAFAKNWELRRELLR